jgi:hypothetical protein
VKAVPFSLLDPPSCIWLLFFFLLSPSLLSCPWLLWVSSYLDNKHHRCASSFFMMPYALERDMRERERDGEGETRQPFYWLETQKYTEGGNARWWYP